VKRVLARLDDALWGVRGMDTTIVGEQERHRGTGSKLQNRHQLQGESHLIIELTLKNGNQRKRKKMRLKGRLV
jgi:hypothetical protein